jgi:hypothetical protein
MGCDLERLFGELAARLPTSEDEEMRLDAATLPHPPLHLTTDRLYIEKGLHDYDGVFRADVVLFHAHKSTYRHLGLLILAVMFHTMPEAVEIDLSHPATAINRLIVESPYKGPDEIQVGYNTRPYVFSYSPEATTRYPWPYPLAPVELPCFYLTNYDYAPGMTVDEEWANRDTLRGFGTDVGSARLAELLLNASQPNNLVDEYAFEGDGGNRKVGHLSAEARFWLLGSAGWDLGQWGDEEE